MGQPGGTHEVQGEGDYEAARRYDKSSEEFAKSGKVDEAAKAATPKTPQEGDSLKKAEEIGRSRAKGEDPALRKPGTSSKT